MGTKKILYLVTKSTPFGGAQRYVYELATALPKDNFNATVAFGGKGVLADMLRNAGIPTMSIPHLERDVSFMKEVRAFFFLIQLFRTEHPDIVHLNSSKAGGLGALSARIAGVKKIIFTAHGWPHQEKRPFLQKFLIYISSWVTVLLAHETIVVSQKDLKTAPALFKKKSVRLIHNGVRPFTLTSRDDARDNISKAVGKLVPSDALWVGTISELTRNKGLDTAIRAIAKVPDLSFIIVGAGEERGQLELLAADLKIHERVYFAGFIPDARRLLKAFDIYTLTSQKEGLPYALLEAGLAGLPVIASGVGGIPDIVQNEVSGLLVKRGSVEQVATALQRLKDNPELRQKYAGKLNKHVSENFTFEKMLRETEALYKF